MLSVQSVRTCLHILALIGIANKPDGADCPVRLLVYSHQFRLRPRPEIDHYSSVSEYAVEGW